MTPNYYPLVSASSSTRAGKANTSMAKRQLRMQHRFSYGEGAASQTSGNCTCGIFRVHLYQDPNSKIPLPRSSFHKRRALSLAARHERLLPEVYINVRKPYGVHTPTLVRKPPKGFRHFSTTWKISWDSSSGTPFFNHSACMCIQTYGPVVRP